ncbi:hypothetical protein MANES_10G108400v8 [Manihot esculenta]|uniref:Uncharacterized protein n=1 Tax=Manihot esculenta TaxID=3983 RepID=A0A251JZZ5_MANES|nr:hypothetical protein MANES_10G108400v8 [Manihot esculenta]
MKLVMLMILIVVGSTSFAIQLEVEARKEKIGNQRIMAINFAHEYPGQHTIMAKYDSDTIKKGSLILNADHQMPKLIGEQTPSPPSKSDPSISNPGGSG